MSLICDTPIQFLPDDPPDEDITVILFCLRFEDDEAQPFIAYLSEGSWWAVDPDFEPGSMIDAKQFAPIAWMDVPEIPLTHRP